MNFRRTKSKFQAQIRSITELVTQIVSDDANTLAVTSSINRKPMHRYCNRGLPTARGRLG